MTDPDNKTALSTKMDRLTDIDMPRAAPEMTGTPVAASADFGKPLAGRKVLFVINLDAGGGVEKVTRILGSAFTAWGGQVETLTIYDKFESSNFEKISNISEIPGCIVRANPDMLVTLQPTSSIVAAVTRLFLPRCRVHLVHQSNMPQATHVVPRTLDWLVGTIGLFPIIIANSIETEKAFANYPAAYRKHIERIEHGIDWQQPRRSRKDMREELGLSETTPLLVTCARLTKQKRIDAVVAAMPLLPDVHFAIAGDGPHRSELEAQANDLGVADRVHFLGHQKPDLIPDLNAAADVFVFPSCWETFGLAALEAAMQGTPIVASSLAVTREVLTVDGKCAATFVGDWEKENWADMLRCALSDPRIKQAAVEAAPILRAHHSEEGMLKKYARIIEAAEFKDD